MSNRAPPSIDELTIDTIHDTIIIRSVSGGGRRIDGRTHWPSRHAECAASGSGHRSSSAATIASSSAREPTGWDCREAREATWEPRGRVAQ